MINQNKQTTGGLRAGKSKQKTESRSGISRRSFLHTGVAAGAGAAALGLSISDMAAKDNHMGGPGPGPHKGPPLNPGDAAILRFLAAAEILETDAWQQYNELAGIQDSEVPGGSGNPAYTAAVAVLDSDMAQYIHDNTEDEFTHFGH
jgi:hypothetical protein